MEALLNTLTDKLQETKPKIFFDIVGNVEAKRQLATVYTLAEANAATLDDTLGDLKARQWLTLWPMPKQT